DDTPKAGGAALWRHAAQLLQERAAAVGIASALAAVARRQDTGTAAKRVDLESRIVSEREQPGGRGDGSRLPGRGGDIRHGAVWGHLDAGEVAQVEEAIGQVAQENGQLAGLGGIRRGEDERRQSENVFSPRASRARRCRPTSRPMPVL